MNDANDALLQLREQMRASGLTELSQLRFEARLDLLAWVLPRLRDPADQETAFHVLNAALSAAQDDGLDDAITVCQKIVAKQPSAVLGITIAALQDLANRNRQIAAAPANQNQAPVIRRSPASPWPFLRWLPIWRKW